LLLAESLLLAVIGGIGGVLLANWGLEALLTGMLNGMLPRSGEIALNIPVLTVSLILTVLTGLASGLASGITASTASPRDAFKESARASAGSSARRLRAALIVTEIAVALVLLAGTGLLGLLLPGREGGCRPAGSRVGRFHAHVALPVGNPGWLCADKRRRRRFVRRADAGL
jgi:hypothetical protein